MTSRERDRGMPARPKSKRTSTTQEDTMAIDVANVSDDIYYDRRNLRDSLDNKSDSWSSSGSAAAAARMNNNPSSSSSESTNNKSKRKDRNHSLATLPTSNKSRSSPPNNLTNNSNSSSRSNSNKKKMQKNDQSIVDIPNFRDMVVPTTSSDNSSNDLRPKKLHIVNTNFEKKDTLDGSHLDWEGDGITVASGNTLEEMELNKKNTKKKKKKKEEGAVIIVHDKEKGGRRGRKGEGRRSPSSNSTNFTTNRRASLGLDMPIFSKVSRKSSRIVESIWGDATDDEDSTIYSNSIVGGGGGKKKEVVKSAWRDYVYKVKNHGKMIFLCIAVSVFCIAVIIVIVTMVPIWLQSEERGESGELGGLAYGDNKGDGVIMDSSSSSSSGVMTDSNDGGVVVDSEGEDTVPAAAASSKLALSPPPYNLDDLCKQETLLDDGGYDNCVSACFPSRCCLIEESQTYKVWTLHIGANDAEEIGETISSCFNDHEDTCIRYNEACSVLGKDSLLPVKPPSSKEVLAMNNSEKLQLAEEIIQACSPAGEEEGPSEGQAECQALCETKACCFVEDTEEEETVRVTDTGTNSILDTSGNSTGTTTPGRNSTLDTSSNSTGTTKLLVDAPLTLEEEPHTAENTTEISGRNMRSIKYCGNDPQEFCVTYAGCEAYFQ
mmetsp:Transcript_7954/g.12451  ORF Transcript_7954/g.12451 Transcript_7954/m.12451 type:complete len:661 (+) Transcript_7954:201-2183(+)